MSLAAQYARQFRWRPWPRIFDALPPLQGQTILDLGCGTGDLAAVFVARGARVIGIDANEELLAVARARQLPTADFRRADLRTFSDPGVPIDGLWCSFTAAYFPELPAVLAGWTQRLRPEGWMALTEIDDLFGHEPLRADTRALLAAYAQDALDSGRYDFRMGRKLQAYLEHGGFTVSTQLTLEDGELAFSGPAAPEVIEAWRGRLERMTLLRTFAGPRFESVRDEFLACLRRADHRANARVYCCIATRHDQPEPESASKNAG